MLTSSSRLAARLAARLVVVVALAAVPLVLIAGNGPLLPGTQPATSTDPTYPPFLDATNPGTLERPGLCDNCHADYRTSTERIYEPFDTWAGSMMAQSARDPLFWAAVDIANQDDDSHLGDAGVGDLCIRCHVPWAWYEGRSNCTTAWGEQFDGACLTGPKNVADTDYEGIFCSFCHRQYDASAPPAGQFADPAAPHAGNAQIYLSTVEREMRGPYSDAVPLSHTAVQSGLHASAAFCGQCHDVTSPAKNRRDPTTGADLGYRMPIERTWSEYSQSRYADLAAPEHATCQSCHMPPPDHDADGIPDDGYACSQQPGLRGLATTLEGPLHRHVFAGANSWMLGVLRDMFGADLGRVDQFNAVIDEVNSLLSNRTVAAGITAPPSVRAGDSLPISLRVTNLAGHKFPTGYPEGRRAWIRVTAGEDLNGDGALAASERQFESGAWDLATGVLTHDAQLKLYEIQLGVWNYNGTGACDLVDDASGSPMFHFVLNDCVVMDDRIPPLGFVPNAETQPVAYVYPPNPTLPGTLANWDDTPYAIPIADTATRSILVEARVLYQTTSKEYIEFLRDASRSTCDPSEPGCNPTLPDARPNRGEAMYDLWAANERSAPVELALARATVALVVPGPGACCVSGGCQQISAGNCRLAEGDFQGEGTACATAGCPPPALPPGEASDVLAGAAPLLVTARDRATGMLTLSYAPACDATDHAIVSGPLAGVRTYGWSALNCGLGVSGSATFDPGAGSVFFVVVGRSSVAEGSYGSDSRPVERPQHVGSDPCDVPQDLSATCG